MASIRRPEARETAAAMEADDDEWEYEYSETETETYYLTLDLSVRDFIHQADPDDIIRHTRGGYKVWYNPLFNVAEPVTTKPQLADEDEQASDDDDDEEPPEREEVDPEDEGIALPATRQPFSPPPPGPQDSNPNWHGLQKQPDQEPPGTGREGQARSQTSGNDAHADGKPEEIQILGLHSAEPIIMYRNLVFCGMWAENIGTEMIFARSNDGNDDGDDQDAAHPRLPALCRDLPGGVDLLAASATRINFRELNLAPKDDWRGPSGAAGSQYDPMIWHEGESADDPSFLPERYRRNEGVYVHVGGDKIGQRRPQAHFLEDLISLKRKRGEHDEVTILPTETLNSKGRDNAVISAIEDSQPKDWLGRTRQRKKRAQEPVGINKHESSHAINPHQQRSKRQMQQRGRAPGRIRNDRPFGQPGARSGPGPDDGLGGIEDSGSGDHNRDK